LSQPPGNNTQIEQSLLEQKEDVCTFCQLDPGQLVKLFCNHTVCVECLSANTKIKKDKSTFKCVVCEVKFVAKYKDGKMHIKQKVSTVKATREVLLM
jgi:hypothetical protein